MPEPCVCWGLEGEPRRWPALWGGTLLRSGWPYLFLKPCPCSPHITQVLDTWRDSGFTAPVLRSGSCISLPRPFIPCLPCPILAPMEWIIPDDSCLWAHFPLVAFWKQPLPPTSSGRDTLAFQGSQSMSSEVLSLAVG